MIIKPSPDKPRETDGTSIDVVSTSAYTAAVSPIILNSTDIIRTKFEPNLVKNEKEPQKSISGKLIYEKKRKTDDVFPSEKITRQSVKIGEMMEISLDTTETYNLLEGLQQLYKLYEDIGKIPYGGATFTRIDSSFKQFLSTLQNDPSAARMIGNKENYELVKLILQMITQTDSLDSLKDSLKKLQEPNIIRLFASLNIERLERTLDLMQANLGNDNEEFWQQTFSENQWIISQLFAYPCTIFNDKAYMGGKGIDNRGGNLCDFIYRNSLTHNVVLVEIKTPCTDIVGSSYRGTYSFSSEMSGAINQVLNYRDKLTKEFYAICHNSVSSLEVFSPKCFVLIGKLNGLNPNQIAAIENYRNTISNVIIITYDEMVKRIKDLLDVFEADEAFDETAVKIDEDNFLGKKTKFEYIYEDKKIDIL